MRWQDIVGEIVGQAQVACLMCLGHNKGWEEAVSVLAVQPTLYVHRSPLHLLKYSLKF